VEVDCPQFGEGNYDVEGGALLFLLSSEDRKEKEK
jgi:hypothetical protein